MPAGASCIDVLVDVERTLAALLEALATASTKPASPPPSAHTEYFGVSEPIIHQNNVRVRVTKQLAVDRSGCITDHVDSPAGTQLLFPVGVWPPPNATHRF